MNAPINSLLSCRHTIVKTNWVNWNTYQIHPTLEDRQSLKNKNLRRKIGIIRRKQSKFIEYIMKFKH